MVCGPDPVLSNRRTCNIKWDKVPEAVSISVSFLDRSCEWRYIDIGCSGTGSQRNHIMYSVYVSTFSVLYSGLYYASCLSAALSGIDLESYKNNQFSFVPWDGNCTGVYGESGAAKNVPENIVNSCNGIGNGIWLQISGIWKYRFFYKFRR